MKGRTIQVEQ